MMNSPNRIITPVIAVKKIRKQSIANKQAVVISMLANKKVIAEMHGHSVLSPTWFINAANCVKASQSNNIILSCFNRRIGI